MPKQDDDTVTPLPYQGKGWKIYEDTGLVLSQPELDFIQKVQAILESANSKTMGFNWIKIPKKSNVIKYPVTSENISAYIENAAQLDESSQKALINLLNSDENVLVHSVFKLQDQKTKNFHPVVNIKVLGSGGFGKVLAIQNLDTKQFEAVKVVKLDRITPAEFTSLKELKRTNGQVLLRKTQKNKSFLINKSFLTLENAPAPVQSSNEKLYLQQSLASGIPLHNFIDYSKKTLSEKQLVEISKNLIQELAYIHTHSILHRDIKPENIIINPETLEVKLVDFGLSGRLSQEVNAVFRSPVIVDEPNLGTPGYQAPETRSEFITKAGELLATSKYGYYSTGSDNYATGLVLKELISITHFIHDDVKEKIKSAAESISLYSPIQRSNTEETLTVLSLLQDLDLSEETSDRAPRTAITKKNIADMADDGLAALNNDYNNLKSYVDDPIDNKFINSDDSLIKKHTKYTPNLEAKCNFISDKTRDSQSLDENLLFHGAKLLNDFETLKNKQAPPPLTETLTQLKKDMTDLISKMGDKQSYRNICPRLKEAADYIENQLRKNQNPIRPV